MAELVEEKKKRSHPSERQAMSDLAQIRLKIERAKKHTRDLDAEMCDFRAAHPYRFRSDYDVDTREKVYKVDIQSDTPAVLSLIIGDIIHNLRSALDHLAWKLIIANGKTPKSGPGGTQFVIRDSSAKPKPGGIAVIEGISPDAQKIVDSIQPYNTGNDSLLILNQLDIVDKHQLMLVTAFALSSMTIKWNGKFASSNTLDANSTIFKVDPMGGTILLGHLKFGVENMALINPSLEIKSLTGSRARIQKPGLPVSMILTRLGIQPDGTMPMLQNGEEVGRIAVAADSKDEADFDLTFEIAFSDHQIVQGKPVIPLLTQLTDIVQSFVDRFGVAGGTEVTRLRTPFTEVRDSAKLIWCTAARYGVQKRTGVQSPI